MYVFLEDDRQSLVVATFLFEMYGMGGLMFTSPISPHAL